MAPEDGLTRRQKAAFMAVVFAMFFLFIHAGNSDYRDECTQARRLYGSYPPMKVDVDYACRYTTHPERESWWGDWLPIEGAK